MTTFTDFVPSNAAPFQFQPQLDGAAYNAIVTWNLFARRFYLNIYALDGTLVLSTALVGSPSGIALQSLAWANGTAKATTIAPHGYKVGKTVELTISGASPDAYNGIVDAFIVAADSFSYPIAANPGTATAFGIANYNVDLVGGYFKTSSMVFRQASQQFEVAP